MVGADRRGDRGGRGGGVQRRYLVAIHLDIGSYPLNMLTQGRTPKTSKNGKLAIWIS